MAAAQSFRQLEVWQKAHALVLAVYRMTSDFPKNEQYGLTSQMRRASISVPANIAEGFVKHGRADKIRFYNIAQGSLEETRYFLILSHDPGYSDTTGLLSRVDEVSRMLEAYVGAIASDRSRLSAFFWLPASSFWLLAF